jgi:putative ABC transport system substrate-binding protein
LRKGLTEIGYVEGQNVAFEFRWSEGRTERLPALADELVRRQVAVIVTGGIPAAQAAKAATTNIPIVFLLGVDPVKLDLVASLARPGGNVTGVNFLNRELDGKRLGLLHDLVPQTTLGSGERQRRRELLVGDVRDTACWCRAGSPAGGRDGWR